MSNNIPTDVLLEYAGSDYDDLPPDVQKMCDEAEAALKAHGVDVEADLKATEVVEAPVAAAPASVTVTRDKKAPESFTSRGAARAYASAHGLKVIDNGAGANRWTVSAKGGAAATPTAGVKKKSKQKRTATATATPAAAERSADKKSVALEVYRELEAAGNLKRSVFLSTMESRTGLSAKGASSYFYRIKKGTW